MNWLFKRNKKEKKKPSSNPDFVSLPSTPKECSHHWQDFPPYLLYESSDYEYTIRMIEPYVCLDCKKREDEEIGYWHKNGCPNADEECHQFIKSLEEKYKDILQPRAIVEDKIADLIRMDTQYNKYWWLLHGRSIENKTELKL